MIQMFLAKEKGSSAVPRSYIRYKVCERMGWDYWTYRTQPLWFIEQILEFVGIESEYENRDIEVEKF